MSLPPAITAYATSVPDEPFIPKDTPTFPGVTVTWPTVTWPPEPSCQPSTTDQEIGALKHRVGLLEAQMRGLCEKFKAKKRR